MSEISLDLINQIFFEEEEENLINEFINEEIIDFKVNYLGKKPKKKIEILEKYPKITKNFIPNLAPSAFSHIKSTPKPPPEFIPIKPPPPRPINVNNLSENQKELFDKNLFEQDLIVINKKKEIIEKKENELIKKIPKNLKIKNINEDIYQRLNKSVEKYYEEEDQNHLNKEIIDNPPSIYKRESKKLNETAKKIQEKLNEPEKSIKSYLKEDFELNKPTRAQLLKQESIRREIERNEVEFRRQKLNEEIRKINLENASKRIQIPMKSIKSLENNENKMRERKVKLRYYYESHMRLIQTMKESVPLGQTLLERVINEINQEKF